MKEVSLIGTLQGAKKGIETAKIYLSSQVLASLKGGALAGIVEPVSPVGKVEIRTAYGNIALPENEILKSHAKVQISLNGNILEIDAISGKLIFEVKFPTAQKAKEDIITEIPHLLDSILQARNKKYDSYVKLTEQNYLVELPSIIASALNKQDLNASIWHLTQSLSYSLFFLPLNLSDHDVVIAAYKKNQTPKGIKVYNFEWEHNNTGFSKLDVLFDYIEQRIDFVLASQKPLEESLITSIKLSLNESLELMNCTGQIEFRSNISPDQSLMTTLVREHCIHKLVDTCA